MRIMSIMSIIIIIIISSMIMLLLLTTRGTLRGRWRMVRECIRAASSRARARSMAEGGMAWHGMAWHTCICTFWTCRSYKSYDVTHVHIWCTPDLFEAWCLSFHRPTIAGRMLHYYYHYQ